MSDLLSDLGIEAGTMALMWCLALAFPFRALAARPELRLDAVAVAFAFLFALAAGSALGAGFDALFGAASGGGLTARWFEFVGGWPLAAVITGFVLFADCTSYWAHRLLHTRAVWHGHAFHHSSRHLYVLSGLRAPFVHVALLFAGPLAGLVLFPLYESPLALALIGISQVANQHYTHSNIRLPFARQIEWVFVTPRYHFVHHSVDRGLSNSNFGFLLTFWDRLFGTYTDPGSVRPDEPLGLDYANSHWRFLAGLAPKRAA